MYELISLNDIAVSEKDAKDNEHIARRLVKGKGRYHGYMFRQVPGANGDRLKIVAEYIDANGSLQTESER